MGKQIAQLMKRRAAAVSTVRFMMVVFLIIGMLESEAVQLHSLFEHRVHGIRNKFLDFAQLVFAIITERLPCNTYEAITLAVRDLIARQASPIYDQSRPESVLPSACAAVGFLLPCEQSPCGQAKAGNLMLKPVSPP